MVNIICSDNAAQELVLLSILFIVFWIFVRSSLMMACNTPKHVAAIF
jgi:hypothetical protein